MLRWSAPKKRTSLVDGIDYAPDIAVRAYGARVTGTRELDLTIAGADLDDLQKSFAAAGMIKLQPYGQYGMAFVNANTGVIDFAPRARWTCEQPDRTEDGVFNDHPHVQQSLQPVRVRTARWSSRSAAIR